MTDPAEPPASFDLPASHPIETAIEAWFVAQIHDSPVARSTEAFNHLRNALADLKRRIIQEI